MQRLLGPGEALAAFVLGDAKSFVWLIRPEDASFRSIDRDRAAIAQQVAALRAALDPQQNLPNPTPAAFPVAQAQALYQDLLGPETDRLAQVKTLFVVPDGALESLPFAVLVTGPPEGPTTDYPHIAWLSPPRPRTTACCGPLGWRSSR
jgi:CHAT domain-containing protein